MATKTKLPKRAAKIKAPAGWKRSAGMGYRARCEVRRDLMYADSSWVVLENEAERVVLVFNFSKGYNDITGSTYFENDGSWYSFDRRGIDSSFHATFVAKPKSYEHALDVDAIIAEQLKRVGGSRARGGQVDVPGLPGISIRKTKVDTLKSKLKGGESIRLTPAGMGVGYRLALHKPRGGWWQAAAQETAAFFNCPRLFFETIDCD